MKPMSAGRFAAWDVATKEIKLSQSEQSNVPGRFGCKLSRTLTRQRCTSLFMITQHRIQKRSTRTKCLLIGELRMPTLNTVGSITPQKNGLLVTFTLMESRAFGAS